MTLPNRMRYRRGVNVLAIVLFIGLIACSKKSGDSQPSGSAAATGSGAAAAASDTATGSAAAPAPPVEAVSCKDAAKAYAEKLAATPGNILSDAKPDKGLIYYTAISMEDYCVGEDGCCVPWTPAERACVKSADASTVSTCFTGAALSQVNAGLTEVVTSALANRKNNDEATPAEGSGSAK
jgi:hypothetical protein